MSNTKAIEVTKLLKKGITPKEIMNRMAVSAGYISTLRKQLEHKAVEVGGPATSEDRVNEILDKRAATYGTFVGAAGITQGLKAIIRDGSGGATTSLASDQQEALDMICSKIARIVNGNPNYVDSWVDIAGYAQLIVNRLNGKPR